MPVQAPLLSPTSCFHVYHVIQSWSMIDGHIAGSFLGTKSDIADGSLRRWEFRSFNNLCGDYYVAPSFLDKVTVSSPFQVWASVGTRNLSVCRLKFHLS